MSLTEQATASTERWDGLRPRNVVQAARADIERRTRNEEREKNGAVAGEMEPYAFLRQHVKNADGPFGIIEGALNAVIKDREHPKPMYSKEVVTKKGTTELKWVDPSLAGRLRRSTKAHMKHLYSEPLLRAALELEKR